MVDVFSLKKLFEAKSGLGDFYFNSNKER